MVDFDTDTVGTPSPALALSRRQRGDRTNREPGQFDGEDTSAIVSVARVDPAPVRFDSSSGEGEAQALAGSIGVSLLERAEQFVQVFTGNTAAFVLDLDEHALGVAADP